MKKIAVATSGINAFTAHLAAKKLGFFLKTLDKKPIYPIPVAKEGEDFNYFVFTEELSLEKALIKKMNARFYPNSFPMNLLDDKYEFSRWLEAHGLISPVPYVHLDKYRDLDFPILLKSKKSWYNDKKMPRGWVVHSVEEFEKQLSHIDLTFGNRELFFVQKWMGDVSHKLISVCGFHDSCDHKRNINCLAERIMSDRDGLSCSAMVEVVEDSYGLTSMALEVLDKLDFCGVYEIELIVTDRGECFFLEINPRFWLQHAIFMFNGNGLMKRYLGLDLDGSDLKTKIEPCVWLNSERLLLFFLMLRWNNIFKMFFYARKKKIKLIIWPTLGVALRALLKTMFYRFAWRKKG